MITQIYEIQTVAEAEEMVDLGVDHIGSVLLSETEWKVPAIADLMAWLRDTPARSSLIPLFSTPDPVFRTLEHYRPDIVHFCDAVADETGIAPECEALVRLQEEVKRRFPEIRIMRSIPMAQPGMGHRVPSLEAARMFEAASDFFLTDTLILPETGAASAEVQPVTGFVGITGKICDWDVAADLVRTSRIPVILAGGLGPDNVAEAIRRVRPAGVDSCSNTNAVGPDGRPIRFRKDREKVRRFVARARAA